MTGVEYDSITGVRTVGDGRFRVRVERDGDDVLVSPLLGSDGLCERCWLLRRIATMDLAGLVHPDGLIAAYELRCAADVPAELGSPVADVLRNRQAEALVRGSRPFPDTLARVRSTGEVTAEVVLPLPECPVCRNDQPAAGDLSYLVGAAAGIVPEVREVLPLPGEPEFPHVVLARLANSALSTRRPFWTGASGKGGTAQAALRSALGECVERYSADVPAGMLRLARASELPAVVDLDRLTGLPNPDDVERSWVLATAVDGSGRTAWVPAAAVYLGYLADRTRPFSSNGLAAGSTLSEAVSRAYAEVVERHAFFAAWYGMTESTEVDPAEWMPEAAESFDRHGVQLQAALLGRPDAVTVACATCWPRTASPDRPGFTLGLGTGPDPARAVRAAVLECGQVYRGLSYALADSGLRSRAEQVRSHPELIAEPYDHGLFYATRRPDQVPAPFGLGPARPGRGPDDPPGPANGYFVDVTPTDIASATGLRVARVVVADAIPHHWGLQMIPIARIGRSILDWPVAELIHPLA